MRKVKLALAHSNVLGMQSTKARLGNTFSKELFGPKDPPSGGPSRTCIPPHSPGRHGYSMPYNSSSTFEALRAEVQAHFTPQRAQVTSKAQLRAVSSGPRDFPSAYLAHSLIMHASTILLFLLGSLAANAAPLAIPPETGHVDGCTDRRGVDVNIEGRGIPTCF
ncbi:hypothetical protein K523DRAFT_99790 [Schizophyllum commune Tattone D]|nr:hypothetical protein K523DRAFT_99790 [Schizophyllum commune Tattone D]